MTEEEFNNVYRKINAEYQKEINERAAQLLKNQKAMGEGAPIVPKPPAQYTKNMEEGGIKHDTEKPRMDLLSSMWLLGTAQVLTFGAKKYAAHNWRKGIEGSRLFAALQRHLMAWNDGEDMDPETGLSHLLHASCCLMFLYETMLTRPNLDDRYRNEDPHL
jgi:hypothetical protein